MGWFDNDPKEGTQRAADPKITPPRRAPVPTSNPRSGSTIGERVRIKGTIHSDEDLTIVGKVEGTIHASGALLIAQGADVKAVIHCREIAIDGSVTGDVLASETVILGASGRLGGNISTPSLEIREGAFFKGAVEMKQPAPKQSASKQPASKQSASTETASGRGLDAQQQPSKRAAVAPPLVAHSSAGAKAGVALAVKGEPPVPATSSSRDRA